MTTRSTCAGGPANAQLEPYLAGPNVLCALLHLLLLGWFVGASERNGPMIRFVVTACVAAMALYQALMGLLCASPTALGILRIWEAQAPVPERLLFFWFHQVMVCSTAAYFVRSTLVRVSVSAITVVSGVLVSWWWVEQMDIAMKGFRFLSVIVSIHGMFLLQTLTGSRIIACVASVMQPIAGLFGVIRLASVALWGPELPPWAAGHMIIDFYGVASAAALLYTVVQHSHPTLSIKWLELFLDIFEDFVKRLPFVKRNGRASLPHQAKTLWLGLPIILISLKTPGSHDNQNHFSHAHYRDLLSMEHPVIGSGTAWVTIVAIMMVPIVVVACKRTDRGTKMSPLSASPAICLEEQTDPLKRPSQSNQSSASGSQLESQKPADAFPQGTAGLLRQDLDNGKPC